jgi:hypothetical protein
MPAFLKDAELADTPSRANIAHLMRPVSYDHANHTTVDEIYGLLHVVTSASENENGRQLESAGGVEWSKPVDLGLYASNIDWVEEAKRLDDVYPVVVFSKVRRRRRRSLSQSC